MPCFLVISQEEDIVPSGIASQDLYPSGYRDDEKREIASQDMYPSEYRDDEKRISRGQNIRHREPPLLELQASRNYKKGAWRSA